MLPRKVRRVGNSLGITLPKAAAAGLGVGEADSIFLVEGPDGMRLTRFDPDFERKMKAVDKTTEKYDDTLSRLAK